MTARSVALFVVAAVAEIGGAYLMWQAIKEGRGVWFALAGALALTGYGAVAALQPDAHFGRVLAAYGGVFIVVFAVVALIGWMIRAAVNAVRLGGLDRIAGLALGAVRGVVLACVLVLLLGYSALPHEPSWQQSRVVPWLQPGAQWMREQLPGWSVPVPDLGKLALPGDNGYSSATGQPVAASAAEGRAGEGGNTATAEPAAALPTNIEPAPVSGGEHGPRRADPHGQARPPSQ